MRKTKRKPTPLIKTVYVNGRYLPRDSPEAKEHLKKIQKESRERSEKNMKRMRKERKTTYKPTGKKPKPLGSYIGINSGFMGIP